MDRAEYQVKLESIKSLVASGDKRAAAQVADTIDWNRVKTASTLCMISGIYESNDRLSDADNILQIAYRRSPINKGVLSRIVDSKLRLGDLAEAERFTREYEDASPNDANNYLLKYKLLKAQRASLRDRIEALEKYKDAEFSDKYTLELARLYNDNGQYAECEECCKDISLWFEDGEYVDEAKSLAKRVKPLAVRQREEVKKEEEVKSAVEAAKKAEEEEKREEFRKADAGELEGRLKDSIRAVFAGIEKPDNTMAPDFEARVPESSQDSEIKLPAGAIKDLEPENIAHKDAATASGDGTYGKEIIRIADNAKDLEELLRETRSDFADEISSGEYRRTEDEPEVADDKEGNDIEDIAGEVSAAYAQDTAAGSASFEAGFREEFATREQLKDDAGTEKAAYEQLTARETDESLGLTRNFDFNETLREHQVQADPASDIRKMAREKTLSSVGISTDNSSSEADKAYEDQEVDDVDVIRGIYAAAVLDGEIREVPSPEAGTEKDQDQSIIEDIIAKPEYIRKVPMEPRALEDEEKELFSYFSQIPGISEQVTLAINDVHNNAGDKTSRAGNVIIIGRPGSGKSRLAKALMLSICRDLGISAVRSAKILASDLNEKDPAEVIARLAGGFLMIEEAGALTDETVRKLLQAMEFRTDDLVVMMEDEKPYIRSLKERNPDISKKFTSTIMIPVFTNDELVSFGKTYLKERGYRMDEMAVLALYTMIGDNQSATEPVTVGRVKDMLDGAIKKAGGGTKKFGRRLSRKAVDKDGRILLREKDFEI